MSKYPYKLIISALLLLIIFNFNTAMAASNIDNANSYLYKASVGMTIGEKKYYANKAKDLYLEEYNKNNLNLDAMIGLGKSYCLMEQRTDAKNILMQAYSIYSDKPKIQVTLGDFNYYFQDYNTALEFYKLALSSGYLKDFRTNLSTAKCYEKLGDSKNAKLYFQITLMINPLSTEAKKRLYELENKNSFPTTPTQKTIFQNQTDPDDIDINTLIENSQSIKD